MDLFCSYHLMMLYICTKSHENVFDGLKLCSRYDFHKQNCKGARFYKIVGGVLVLVLCTSSDGGLYLYQVS